MDTTQINQLTNVLIKGQQNVDSLFTKNFDLNFISRVIGEVTQEMQRIRNCLDRFKKVEILESCMKALHQDLFDANILYKDEQAKAMQKTAKSPRTQNTMVRRPQSPMSPMVNPSGYAPLSQTSHTDDNTNKSKVFDLDEKFDNLDLDQD